MLVDAGVVVGGDAPAGLGGGARIERAAGVVHGVADIDWPRPFQVAIAGGGAGAGDRLAARAGGGLGAPARYVSGYIRTIPPEGKPRLEGADATHAWVDVWCGPETGWAGFDPTNAMEAGNDHIELAIGRDFSDVSPIHGVVLGSGEQDLDVEVDVIPVAP